MKIRNFILIILIIIFGYFFINHQNDEEIVNHKYQEALKLWKEGKQKKALDTLDEILIKYKKNDLTKKIYRQKSSYEKIYFLRFNPHSIKKDIFSAVVQNSINEYFKKFYTYPDNLESLSLSTKVKKYLNLCEYEKYSDKEGFYINCKKLENKYNEAYNKDIESLIPINSFITYYSNIETETDAVYSEVTNEINLKTNGKFQKINSNLINTYWIGYIKVKKNEKRTISISQNSSKIKMLIDNEEVFNGSNSKELNVSLKKGLHKIEIKFFSISSTIRLNINLDENKKHEIYGKKLVNFFNKVAHIDYEPVVVSINESNRDDYKIDIYLKKFSKPIVLFLSSYESVEWNIFNPENNKIFAIVYSSGYISSVFGDIKNTLLIKSNIKFPPKIKKKSSCHNHVFNISGSNIYEVQKKIYEITSKNLTNFTGDYRSSEIIVPMLIVDDKLINETKKNMNDIQNKLEECKQEFKRKNFKGKLYINKG